MLQIGFAKVTITPPLPVQLAGYGVERTGTGVADQLHARAMVCEQDGRRVGLLCADLLWLERRHLKVLREQVAAITGIAPQDLMVAASHTHSGPDTMDWFHFAPVDPQWLHALLKQLASAVFLAAGKLTEARLERLVGAVEIGVNRRVHKEREGFRIGVNTAGPVDHTLTVLRCTAPDGRLLGSVLHQATHPVVLSGQSTVISADWPGVACRTVEQVTGGCCLFVNGACGDINPGSGRAESTPKSSASGARPAARRWSCSTASRARSSTAWPPCTATSRSRTVRIPTSTSRTSGGWPKTAAW